MCYCYSQDIECSWSYGAEFPRLDLDLGTIVCCNGVSFFSYRSLLFLAQKKTPITLSDLQFSSMQVFEGLIMLSLGQKCTWERVPLQSLVFSGSCPKCRRQPPTACVQLLANPSCVWDCWSCCRASALTMLSESKQDVQKAICNTAELTKAAKI